MRCFVFVLFLWTLAEGTTLPTPHGLTKQPSAQDLKLLSHGLNPRIVEKEALRGGIRALLKTTTSDCAWLPHAKECEVSSAALVTLLKKSNSELAKYLLGEFVCFGQKSKSYCNKLAQCEWESDGEECSLGDMSYGHDDSPCIKVAPVLFKVVHYGTVCSKIESKESCSSTKNCIWSEEDKGCAIDFFKVAFHLKSYRQKTGEVFSSMVQEKSSAIVQDPMFSSSEFTWETVLKWDPPKATCPTGQQNGICEVVEAYLSVYLPAMIYCQGKYTTESACEKDKLCMVSAYGNCSPSDKITQKAGKALADVLIGMLSYKTDKFYINSLFFCSDYTNERKCHRGGCSWDLETKKCHLNSAALFREVVKASGSTKDGLCAFLDTVSSDKCDEEFRQKQCSKRDECEWEDSSGCSVNDEVLVLGALKGSSGASEEFKNITKQCAAKDSKAECTGASYRADAITYVQ